MGSPVHGFTSGNTSTNSPRVGGSAAAGAANARATTLSRATTSLITGLPSGLSEPRPDGVRSRQVLQAAGKVKTEKFATAISHPRREKFFTAEIKPIGYCDCRLFVSRALR